ncbi:MULTISPECIES: ABC transporter permease [unclassified Actinomyces]|uniref:ABC transporter permease n=1 Tax=unclassified Actinomyces TaxID=2609248 RepID=UPI001373D9D6|nr:MULTISPECIES: ABC transporter permease [unclassified Actinomyces]MBW3069521.1 ABC transporter permease [Actinomyces sp. 594]NDR53486.1 ABC transporter permease [Actinomyces sp. 565]QHO90496.1 peptide ABC transporter permease [Actinomyces sp. 432]
MFPYLMRRLANYAILLFIATSLAYLLASASLDPANNWNREDPSLNWDAINAALVQYNISSDMPVWGRYVTWLREVVTSWDWGVTPKGESINALLGTKIAVSVRLVFLGAMIGMVGGVALGAWTATRQYKFSDRAISLLAMIVISTPAMVLAILLQVLAVHINRTTGYQIFEFTGEGEGFLGRAQHLLLPTLSMSLGSIASYSRYQRNLMLDTLGADYVRTARAKGLRKHQAATRHALRTALIPMATYFAFALAGLFTGAAITERVYGWHGMGEYSINSISSYDINGVTAVVAFSGLCTLAGALLSDVFVAIVDPRVRVS